MFTITLILTSALVLTTTAIPTLSCPFPVGAADVRVRLPPSLSLNPNLSWLAPPPEWYFKPWDMIYSSNSLSLAFRNLQYDPTAIDPTKPAGQVNDLSSFQFPGNDTVYTTYGIDTPDTRQGYAAVLHYEGTGILAGAISEYSIMAWGCDTNSNAYYVPYSTETALTATPAAIDIFSTSDKGPDSGTVTALMTALKSIQSPKIQPLVATLTKMTQDGARNGKPRVVSGLSIVKNNSAADYMCPGRRTPAIISARLTRI
jgi:hypothetical protein